MGYVDFIEYLVDRFPDFESLKNHINRTLSSRDHRAADYSNIPDNHPEAGVLLSLVLPKEVIENDFSPIPHLHIIYEKRSNTMKNHPNQMAFPGGTLEDRDNGSPKYAAYREAEEEVGINPNDLEFVSYMDEFVASSNILVHPVVAWLIEDVSLDNFIPVLTKKYSPKTSESVATVIMPITHLLNPDYYRSRPYTRNGKQIGFVRYFDTTEIRPDDNIWGLTASMTRRFIDTVFPDNLLPEESL